MMVQPVYMGIGFSLLTFACSDDADSDGAKSSSSNTTDPAAAATTTGGTEKSLDAYCDAQVAPACPKTPAGYAASCKQIFVAQRKKLKAECTAKFDAFMECGATKQTYTCTASGTAQGSPTGACANEGAACDSCNGASCTLAGLLGP